MDDQYRVLSEQGQRMARQSRSRSPIRRDRSRSRSPRGGANNPGQKLRVYVRNLPFETKWMELKDVMKKCGQVAHAEVFTDERGKSKGCGVVEFVNQEDAERAIKEIDGQEVNGRPIRVREDIMDDDTYQKQLANLKEKSRALKNADRDGPRDGGRGGRDSMGGGRDDRGGSGGGQAGGVDALLQRETYKQQMFSILNSKNPDPVNCSVFVSNLEYDVTWQTLKDTFRRAGTCVRCDIQQDQDRKSKGFGTVVFETPFEALVSIALFHQAPIGAGRPMACRLDRSAPLTLLMNNLNIEYQKFTCAQLVQLQAQATLALTQTTSMSGLGGYAGLAQQSAFGGGSAAAGLNLAQLLAQASGGGGGLAASMGGGSGGYSGGGGNMNSGYDDRGRDSRNDDRGRERSSRSSQPGCKIFVSNLPFSMTWQQLKDKCKDSGLRVVRAEIQEQEGRSKGMGTAEFDSPEEAQRAIKNLHGSMVDGREMRAKLDGAPSQPRRDSVGRR